MLLGDYVQATSFLVTGIPNLLDWVEEETGVIADVRNSRKRGILAQIG